MPTSRRQFMMIAASLASTAVLSKESRADAAVLTEIDSTARALGYKTDASQIDKTKYPKYQTGQVCGDCQLYQGKPGSAEGPCPIYGGKLVDAKGWCSAYVKKT